MNNKDLGNKTLKECRELLQKSLNANQRYQEEVNKRWKAISLEKRRYLCKLGGCEDAAKLNYTEIEKGDKLKIRAALSRLEGLIKEFSHAIKQG